MPDRIAICEAHYMFTMLFHGGQGCPIYAKFAQLERIRFRPSPLLTKPAQLDWEARQIYQCLVEKSFGVKSTVHNLQER